MMRARLAALVFAFGCNTLAPSTPTPKEAPAPTEAQAERATKAPAPAPAGCPAPAPGDAMTREQCTCLGGRLNLSRGGEQAHCAPDEQELGTVRFGIEGGWCCKAP